MILKPTYIFLLKIRQDFIPRKWHVSINNEKCSLLWIGGVELYRIKKLR